MILHQGMNVINCEVFCKQAICDVKYGCEVSDVVVNMCISLLNSIHIDITFLMT